MMCGLAARYSRIVVFRSTRYVSSRKESSAVGPSLRFLELN